MEAGVYAIPSRGAQADSVTDLLRSIDISVPSKGTQVPGEVLEIILAYLRPKWKTAPFEPELAQSSSITYIMMDPTKPEKSLFPFVKCPISCRKMKTSLAVDQRRMTEQRNFQHSTGICDGRRISFCYCSALSGRDGLAISCGATSIPNVLMMLQQLNLKTGMMDPTRRS